MTVPLSPVSMDVDVPSRTLALSFPFDTAPERVWSALTDLASVGAWLAPAVAEGTDRYVLTFDHEGHVHDKVFEVAECVPGRTLTGVLHDPGHPDSVLSARIGKGTFTLTHTDVSEALIEGYSAGWPYYLGRLAGLLAEDDGATGSAS
ncbi:SRPBCC domain-containing protein [Nocardiopsis sp. N85]|uniref:SRPBCC domain-containing protein n=1 Tax=Nocardiopsis sp. N85 TaxID=3029400 RepID=UPI00237FD4A6|nr:SRPBCC domain-containing protein [Nocardiopsis sp. N85]MDE3723228.1 SRPBCC domain-containing protein [Nocardiopsis sp. N85]